MQLDTWHSLGWIFCKVMQVRIIYDGTVQEFVLSLAAENKQPI